MSEAFEKWWNAIDNRCGTKDRCKLAWNAAVERCAEICLTSSYGTGLTGRTYAEAIEKEKSK